MLNFLPMFWIAGENSGLINPIFTGATLVLMARWDPLGVMQAIDRYRVRRLFLVVDNALEIMDHPQAAQYDLRSLQTVRVASFVQKISLDIRRRWQALTGTVMAEGAWGMTETHTSDTFTTGMQDGDQDLLGRPGFVGLPVPGTLIKICDFDTGALLPPGQDGEIVVSTPSLFKGYWQRPEATAEAIRDGWFHTGDIGAYDEKGFLHYLSRRKEMLKVRGMSVFPPELEVILSQHPAVHGAAVVGRPDADKGQVPVAFIKLRPGATTSAAELHAWCREQMATYKVPEIRLIADWPMTGTGKIKKHELQELADQPVK
jgi:fatty-acyl-CoA synthase/long-chain acyl-CoA synthetase